MIEKKKVYFCENCGNIVESLWNGKPDILCCGRKMEELTENTKDAAVEKHVPAIKRDGDKVTVTVGEVEHPMVAEHYILFVEVIAGNDVYRHDFVEGDNKPVAEFTVPADQKIKVRAFCNLHGLWAAEA
jgi:superoxide reductase